MTIGVSLVLIALGAILKFGVDSQHSHGFDIGSIGVILMIVGAVGLLITLIMLSVRRRTDVVTHSDGINTRTTVVEPNDDTRLNY